MSMLSLKSGRRAAVTLVELTLMLALGAIVVAIAIRAYYWSAENERVRQAISLIGITRDSIASRYGMQPNYQNLSNDMVVSAFPKSLVVPGSSNIRDPFGGHLIVGPDRVSSLGDSNYIALTNLTPNACNKLSRADMGRDAAFIKVGASGPVYKAMALPLSQEDQATVDGLCKSSERVSVSWQFAAAGNALTTTPTGPDCISTACITAAKLDILDEILAAYSGDPLYAQSVARNTLFLLADTQHYSWASTDPNAPMSDARSLLSDLPVRDRA